MQSLYAEAGEPSLRHRRMKLSMNYFLKLKKNLYPTTLVTTSSTTRHRLSSLKGPKRFHLLEPALSLTSRRRILNQIQLIASTNEHLPPGNTAILCSIPRYHASRKSRRVKQFLFFSCEIARNQSFGKDTGLASA